MDRIATDLALVRQRIAAACQRSGRDPSSVTLVGVTKGVPPEAIRQALALGLTDVGENRVQEARQKYQAFYAGGEGSRVKGEQRFTLHPPPFTLHPLRWHMIGHLQRNKAKDAVELFEVIHSVDSVGLVEELERHAAQQGQGSRVKGEGKSANPLDVFIQVNVSGEPAKFGCTPDHVMALAGQAAQLPHLRLRGLMTIAPFVDDPELTRPVFRQLRQLRDGLVSTLDPSPLTLQLSMGMSGDFEVAIEEGADLVRIGTALFGGVGQGARGVGRP